MPKPKTIELYGVSGTGPTIREAKADAGRKIERLTRERTYAYAHRGHALFVYPTTEGACYTIISPKADGPVHCCACCADVADAIKGGIRHLLDYDRPVGDVDMPSWVPSAYVAEFVDDFTRRDRFYAAYREAINAGETDVQAHETASRAMWAA